jgi:LysM repeat protein
MSLSVRYIIIVPFIFISINSYSFSDSIGIGVKNGQKYILHRIDKSQGLYSVSKRYNVPINDIQKANGDSLANLRLNQVIFIPIIVLAKQKIEIIHEVEKGETLYRISKKYNVSVDDIKTWNNILDKQIQKGDKLKIYQETGINNKVNQISVTPPLKEAFEDSYQTNNTNSELVEVNEEGVATWLDNNAVGSSKSLALHRDAPVGTIIQITSVTNNKTVFVKVVGNLPKDEQKLKPIIEITKYSAKQLGLKDQFFLVKLAYHKKIEQPVEK